MTRAEQLHIDTKFDEVKQMISGLAAEVQTLKRGIYGDEKNAVKGLIQTDKEQHDRIASLEETRKKVIWWGSGAVIAFETAWHFVKSKL